MKLNFLTLLPLAAAAVQTALAATTPIRRDEWPHGPFKTEGNQVKNANGEPVGYNFVRHTYPIQMIDQIYENNGTDITVQHALLYALDEHNGIRIMEMINKNNPQITNSTTRLEVYRAIWCCSHDDGNAWFGDMDFDVSKWHRGHRYMAEWAKKHSNIVSMSLRNELRKSAVKPGLEYNWNTWWGNVLEAAENIHTANPNLLITISGLDYDIDLSALTTQANLYTAPYVNTDMDRVANAESLPPVYADIANTKFGKANKAVLELHAYKMSTYYQDHLEDCGAIQAGLYRFGFNALGESARPDSCNNSTDFSGPNSCPPAKITLPTLLTEFGDAQDSSYGNVTMQKCLRDFTTKNKIGWAHWSLAGSYRIRQNVVFNNDSWGLTNPTKTEYQSKETVDGFFRPWIQDMGKTNLEL
ncbi:related to cellulase [Ustilago sp. UG-2017a]|nr:related to cellulase [Ustilago sp. UG-2017a]